MDDILPIFSFDAQFLKFDKKSIFLNINFKSLQYFEVDEVQGPLSRIGAALNQSIPSTFWLLEARRAAWFDASNINKTFLNDLQKLK